MNLKTTMKLIVNAHMERMVARAPAGNPVPVLDDVMRNRFPRERKEV